MKTIKLISVTVIGLLFSTMVLANYEIMLSSDTIRIKTKDGAEMIIVLNNLSELKSLESDVNTILKSLDKVFEKIEGFDSAFEVSVNNIERMITVDAIKEGERSRVDIQIDAPKIERKPKNLHGFTTFSIGFNNFLENRAFPNDNKEQYSVKNWGSWDVSVGAGMRWYVARPISIDIAGDVSWYNFKFQDRATRVDIDNNGVSFTQDTMGFEYNKSKITVPYLNASIIPMVHFGKASSGLNRNMFRIGAGVYAGYRLGGHVKYVYREDNRRTVYKNRDDYYLNSYRYGLKAVFGFNDFNIYAAYDLNTLFAENKAPELNPISFGFNFIF